MSDATPTVALVHGAFIDGLSWNGVIERLQANGVNVIAPANPLRAVTSAAFAPDEGERVSEVTATSKDAILGPALVSHEVPGGPELSVDPARVHDVFAADLPESTAAVAGATQRPIAAAAFSDASGKPAWRRLPSWAVVATGDKAAGTDLTRSMAERAGARITELDGSHVIMLSQPQAVTEVILEALASVASPAGVS